MKNLIRKIIAALGLLPFCRYGVFVSRVFIVRIRYAFVLKRVRAKKSKIRILFLVHNTSKWKAQSLYEALARHPHFEPIMAVNYFEGERGKYRLATDKMCADLKFYQGLGNDCISAYDAEKGVPMDLAQFNPDVVFFQEPWQIHAIHSPFKMSKIVLCCYMPYSVEYMMDPNDASGVADDMHLMRYFHQMMFANFTWSWRHAEYYHSKRHWWECAGRILGSGHTILDQFKFVDNAEGSKGYTIYAPHFSISYGNKQSLLHLATFKETGMAILEYAKTHPQFNWLFKPHPQMRRWFIEAGYMTAKEVDDYFSAWTQVGSICTDGDYPRLFNRSRALISDSGSFLLEYAVTGRPVIRPVPTDLNVFPCPVAKRIVDSLYETHGVEELMAMLKLVLEDGRDPKREERIAAVRETGLMGTRAAENIVTYFNELFRRI